MNTELEILRRYQLQVQALLAEAAPLQLGSEVGRGLQVERSIALADAVLKRGEASSLDRMLQMAREGALDQVMVVDGASGERGEYRPLLVYCALQTFRLRYETLARQDFGHWEEGLRAWADLLELELTERPWPDLALAEHGAAAAEVAWTALALHVAGKVFIRDAFTDLAADAFGRLIRGQGESGAFLAGTAADQPESQWYHELVILHAAASYAVQAEDKTVAAAVKRNTVFHQAQTQPDHATGHPFGLFAFIWNPQTRLMADQLLHTAQMASGPMNGLTQGLLADVLYCLRLFPS